MSRVRWGLMDEETQRYAAIIKIKQARLHELDKQSATMGRDTPPHIAMEIGSLKEELGMMEIALQSPARANSSDELGPQGRFLVYYQQNREIKQSIAALAIESREGRAVQRQWIFLIGLVVVLILIAVVALVTYLFARGAL